MGEILQNSKNKLTHHAIRDVQDQKIKDRRRNILFLIHNYLLENKFETTANSLISEANLTNTFEICDNVDLETILQEYESYYFSKFGKNPKICKKVPNVTVVETKKTKPKSANRNKIKTDKTQNDLPEDLENNFQIDVQPLNVSYASSLNKFGDEHISVYRTISLQPLENIQDYPGDWKEMYDLISKEIVPNNLNTKWEDCIGLENTISYIQEAVSYPLDYPEFFIHVKPWKGILLYGPPGTGKTLLAKALACESHTIFINVTASTFVSKWRGESEKLIRILFEIAKHNTPCTIFIDELDALSSRRDEQQHEASRRFKSELLIQMDGILNSDDRIFILATSNLPWEIDSAILRRFDKKILVNLPNQKARAKMFEKFLFLEHWQVFTEGDYIKFADETENFSGNDIKLICKNALMSAVRRRIKDYKKKGDNRKDIYYLVNPSVPEVEKAIKNARAIHKSVQDKYEQWQKKFWWYLKICLIKTFN